MENLRGSSYNDYLSGDDGANTLSGGTGDDTLNGGFAGDTLDGSSGIDVASYENAATGVTADLQNPNSNTGEAAGDTYASVEYILGSALGDTLGGDNSANALGGGTGGNDVLLGRGGVDLLAGDIGDDTLNGGARRRHPRRRRRDRLGIL